MSKTYRRKNKTWNFNSYHYTWDNGFLQKFPMDSASEEFKKAKAHFHSDHYTTWSVPHWYVNMYYEKSDRQNTKKQIQQWKKNPDNFEILLDCYMKDAGWTYW